MQNLYYGICGTFLKSAFGAKKCLVSVLPREGTSGVPDLLLHRGSETKVDSESEKPKLGLADPRGFYRVPDHF